MKIIPTIILSICIWKCAKTTKTTLSQCNTMGTNAYALITVTPEIDLTAFGELLQFYAKLMPMNETISYTFFFGQKQQHTETADLEYYLDDWLTDPERLTELYQASLVFKTDKIQYDDEQNQLSPIMAKIFSYVDRDNQDKDSMVKKKQVVLMSDYVPVNVTQLMNDNLNTSNQQVLGINYDSDYHLFDDYAKYPVYDILDEKDIKKSRHDFQQCVPFSIASDVFDRAPPAEVHLFMTHLNKDDVFDNVRTAYEGSTCAIGNNAFSSKFFHLQYLDLSNQTIYDLYLPWLKNNTLTYADYCLSTLIEGAQPDLTVCSDEEQGLVENFVNQYKQPANLSFVTLVLPSDSCLQHYADVESNKIRGQRNQNDWPVITARTLARVAIGGNYSDTFNQLIYPNIDRLHMDNITDNQIFPYQHVASKNVPNSTFFFYNYSTTCRSEIPFVPLTHAFPYRKSKELSIALDDMVWMTFCAALSVATIGTILYRNVKRDQKKQMELLNEIMHQPSSYTIVKENAKTARLPWEIEEDRVHIDMEFLLGEGTVSNVYLGKLKGKAPILQWIDRVEMKQFQDCAVAVRVPKHFDEPNEDELHREIASMRRLKHHNHIALFLGWTNKDNLVCSLLELTHMNLLKYTLQINADLSSTSSASSSTSSQSDAIPFKTLFKIIWEICDGMDYIHSRNLIHRDLRSTNVLLTTGFRAKISGFGFCSEPDDPRITANVLRFLPVKWMSPECFQARFSQKSDVWSFGVLMYEVFSLGHAPYEELTRAEDVMEAIKKSRIPSHPKHASDHTYAVMKRCFHRFPDRRPSFNQLKDNFFPDNENEQYVYEYTNKAFLTEE